MNLDAYIGRGNKRVITLLQGGAPVADNLVTRVVIWMGDVCIDSSVPADPIELTNLGTTVEIQLGLWTEATPGEVTGYMTVYTDGGAAEGYAWPEGEPLTITFHEWGAL